METVEERIRAAMTADGDGLRAFLRDPSDKVVMALLSNRNITEDELVVLARRRNIAGEALAGIAGMKAARDYAVQAALANNPRTPRRVALGILRRLRLRDLAFVTANKALPTELRQAGEGLLKEKMQSAPLGVRVVLARLVSEDVLKALLTEGEPLVTRACFENPRMREAVVLWAVNHETVPGGVVEFISSHPKWSTYYSVRFALTRNRRTPVGRAVSFAAGLKALDQRFLYNDPSVPVSVKVRIEIELERKGQPLHPPRDEGRVIGIVEEED